MLDLVADCPQCGFQNWDCGSEEVQVLYCEDCGCEFQATFEFIANCIDTQILEKGTNWEDEDE